MVLFAFKDDEVLQKILKLVARRNAKRNYFLVLTVLIKPCCTLAALLFHPCDTC